MHSLQYLKKLYFTVFGSDVQLL